MHFVNFPDKLPWQYVKLGHILYNSFTTRYVIPTAVKAKIVVFWDVTPCNFDDYQRVREHWERETSTMRRSRQHVPPKHWYLPTKIQGVKFRKIVTSALLTNHPIIRHYMKSNWNQRYKMSRPHHEAIWGHKVLDVRIINLRTGIMWSASRSWGKNAGAHWTGGYSYVRTQACINTSQNEQNLTYQFVTVCTLHDPSGNYLIFSCSYCRWCLNLAAWQQLHSEQTLMSSTLWHKGHSYLTTLSIVNKHHKKQEVTCKLYEYNHLHFTGKQGWKLRTAKYLFNLSGLNASTSVRHSDKVQANNVCASFFSAVFKITFRTYKYFASKDREA